MRGTCSCKCKRNEKADKIAKKLTKVSEIINVPFGKEKAEAILKK